MRVFLSLDARKFEIEIDPRDQVKTLKMKMLDKAGILPYQLTFYHCGRLLDESRSFEQAKISCESTIQVMRVQTEGEFLELSVVSQINPSLKTYIRIEEGRKISFLKEKIYEQFKCRPEKQLLMAINEKKPSSILYLSDDKGIWEYDLDHEFKIFVYYEFEGTILFNHRRTSEKHKLRIKSNCTIRQVKDKLRNELNIGTVTEIYNDHNVRLNNETSLAENRITPSDVLHIEILGDFPDDNPKYPQNYFPQQQQQQPPPPPPPQQQKQPQQQPQQQHHQQQPHQQHHQPHQQQQQQNKMEPQHHPLLRENTFPPNQTDYNPRDSQHYSFPTQQQYRPPRDHNPQDFHTPRDQGYRPPFQQLKVLSHDDPREGRVFNPPLGARDERHAVQGTSAQNLRGKGYDTMPRTMDTRSPFHPVCNPDDWFGGKSGTFNPTTEEPIYQRLSAEKHHPTQFSTVPIARGEDMTDGFLAQVIIAAENEWQKIGTILLNDFPRILQIMEENQRQNYTSSMCVLREWKIRWQSSGPRSGAMPYNADSLIFALNGVNRQDLVHRFFPRK